MKSWRQWAYLLGLTMGLGLFLFQLLNGLRGLMGYPLALAQLVGLAVACLCSIIAIAFQMNTWHCILRSFGIRISRLDVAKGYVLAFLPRYLPGSLWGYWSRGEWLRRDYSIAYKDSTLGSIIEVLIIFLAGGLIFAVYGIRLQVNHALPVGWAGLAVGSLLVGLLIVMGLRFLLSGDRLPANILRVIKALRAQAIGSWIVSWVLYGTTVLLTISTMGFQYQGGILDATIIFIASWAGGFLVIFVPGGLGVREILLASLLRTIMGVDNFQASTAAVMSRLLVSLAELVWVLIGFLINYGLSRINPK